MIKRRVIFNQAKRQHGGKEGPGFSILCISIQFNVRRPRKSPIMGSKEDLSEIVTLVEQTSDDMRFDTFYYLFSQLPSSELQTMRELLEKHRNPGLLETFLDAEYSWKQYGISMGTLPQETPQESHLMFHLGRLEHFSQPEVGGTCAVPNYYGIGRRYWESIKKELAGALCSKSGVYKRERRKFKEIGHASLTVAVPAVMAALSLPPSLAGVGIVLSVFIAKIGLNAFCRMLREQTPPASPPERQDEGK